MIARGKLALIHIVKRRLGLADEAYRALLQRAAGVTSARDLDEAGFGRLMREFVRSEHYSVRRGGLTFRQKLYIEHLQAGLGWDADHLRNFLRKYYHVARIEDLSRRAAAHCIESLKGVRAHARPEPAPRPGATSP